ncbi:MAG: hypothetical protein DHS20C15_28320 [Planctomycetota bacterium]|nr:MAG: hypothetical protein DHS20C15_28320 [Planctomycetota bacterium]
MLVIANPHGGRGAARARVQEFLRSWPVAGDAPVPDVRWTLAPGDATRWAAQSDESLVVAAGGDGTIHEVVQGLMQRPAERRPTLGLLPAGSGNSLARDLDLLAPQRAAEVLRGGTARLLDVTQIDHAGECRYSFNIVGWALTAEVGMLAESMRWVGARRYDLAAALAITRHRPRPAVIHVDGVRHEGHWSFVYLANTQHTGAGLRLIPEARLDDGLLDVLLVPARSRWHLLRDLARVRRGRGFQADGVVRCQARRVELETTDRLPTNVDGEIAASPPWTLNVLPGALRVLS